MRKIHNPPHIYIDDTIYFLTARTIEKKNIFNTEIKKKVFYKTLYEILKKYNYSLYAWVILDNHYHLLLKTTIGKNLKFFAKDLHSLSAKRANKFDNQTGRKIWFQYWDRCIRNEKDFYFHFNYIHHNPVKHGYVKIQNDVLKYPFCSYGKWIKNKGEEWICDCFGRYSILDFTIEGDE